MPPFGHSTQLRVFVDPDLLQYDEVWAAAGTWNDNFGAAPADIVRVAGGVVADLKRGCRSVGESPPFEDRQSRNEDGYADDCRNSRVQSRLRQS